MATRLTSLVTLLTVQHMNLYYYIIKNVGGAEVYYKKF